MKKILICLVILLTGCATIVNGNRQNISISTAIPGATVKVSGQTLVTPVSASLQRNGDHTVVISKKGYQEKTVVVRKVITFKDLLILVPGNFPTFFTGIFVDYFTESIGSLTPKNIEVALEKEI